MKCDIEADKGQCPLCTKNKEQLLFILRSEIYNGRACAAHMHAMITQVKPVPNAEPLPQQ